MGADFKVPLPQIEMFCKKWKIGEFSLFGSVIREDFRKNSDVDVLVRFLPEADKSFLTRMQMIEECEDILGRKIDFVVESALKNPFRRHEILQNRKVIYAAA